ncbi:hypothetical protein [Alteribacter aurantiacus]|uniref:hypothetical protein n=1 Tax=Alteribacter aurantiacus TaxID=254410 RepID=UPI00047E46C7|nr:hypothetical protein [Alteribacter aurantiacus]
MDNFKKGYNLFQQNASNNLGTSQTNENNINYIISIQKEIDNIKNNINSFNNYKTDVSQLKGDVAEFWHSGTHNIDAASKRVSDRTFVDRSKEFVSPDITGNDGSHYGLKYFKSGEASAKAQSESVFQRYEEYKAKAINNNRTFKSLEEYLAKRGYEDTTVVNDPLYKGQIRIVPSDQIEQAIQWLEKKIIKESIIRPGQVKRYEETLMLLKDRIITSNGSESIPLTKAQSEKLALLGKDGAFDPENFGLTSKDLIDFRYIIEQSFKAGITAGVIAIVLKTAPEIYKAIDYLIKNGEVEEGQFKSIGFLALKGTSFSFVCGTISASITAFCKAGVLGEAYKNVSPALVGAVTVMTLNVMKDAFFVAVGKLTKDELINSLIKGVYISTCSLVLGGITQGLINIPLFGYMLGSFLGSIVGDILHTVSYNTYISFCIENGFTMFGVVDQNYQLPKEILKEIGIDIFDFEELNYNQFHYNVFEPRKFLLNEFKYETVSIKVLRRGVIGVNRIGYV